jgi:hypothetical protein
MGEIILSKSERERIRFILDTRAIHDSAFPPADPVSEQRGEWPQLMGPSGARAPVRHRAVAHHADALSR